MSQAIFPKFDNPDTTYLNPILISVKGMKGRTEQVRKKCRIVVG